MTWIRQLFSCLWKAIVDTINHDGIEHAGYLAFLSLLALFPFLVFVFAIIGFIGQGEAGVAFINYTLHTLPSRVSEALQPRIHEIVSGPPQGLLTLSIVGAIWTASSAVEGMRTVLNRAYRVATPPAYWFRRSLSILQMLLITCIMITGILATVILPVFINHIEVWLGIQLSNPSQHYWSNVVFWVTVVVLFTGISHIYHTITNVRQRFITVAPGAVLVVVLWLGAAWLFGQYLSNFNQVNLIYGSLGGIIATLVFFYICSMIFIFGAEFNHQLIELMGMRTVQREEAEGSPVVVDKADIEK